MRACFCSLGPNHPDCCINNTQSARDERLGRAIREALERRLPLPPIDNKDHSRDHAPSRIRDHLRVSNG